MIDYSKISGLEFDGIDQKDYPDFCDAYICGGFYDGNELTDEQLEEINDDRVYVHAKLFEHLY